VTETVNQLKQYLTIADITVLSQALTTLSVLLRLYPRVTYPVIESQILAIISSLVCSPMVAGAALNSTEEFYGTLVSADNQIASHVIPGLFTALDRVGREGSAANVSKCIARVVRSAMGIAAGTIAEFTKHIKVCLDSCILDLSNEFCSRPRNLKKSRSF
jgi:cullin-associated NEDD8-dissociated protein 1